MRPASRAAVAALGALIGALALGCAHAPTPAELEPVVEARPPREPLPDDTERAAARLAASVWTGRPEDVAAAREALAELDAAREQRGEPPSGLDDNAAELEAACGGSDAFPARAEDLLDQGDLDAALRRRLEQAGSDDPLQRARASLAEERRWRVGAVYNRIAEPISRFLLSGFLNPVDATRTTLATLLTAHRFPAASPRERRALHAYEEWLVRHPEDPRTPEIEARAAALRAKLARERFTRALDGAEEATSAHEPQRAQILAARALAQDPSSARAAALEARATAQLAEREAAARAALEPSAFVPEGLDDAAEASYAAAARAILIAPADDVAARAAAWRTGGAPRALAGELAFVESFGPRARGDEDGFFAALARVPEVAPKGDTIARQATAVISDPEQNPYAYYRAARSADRRARLAWIALGRHANGPTHRDLWRPVEYVLDLPGFVISLVTFPIRIVQYPSARAKFGGAVLETGERYVARFPSGEHAAEVHADLESRYATRGALSAALRHAEAAPAPDAAKLARYRDEIAEQMWDASEREKRIDIKLAILAALVRDYPGTPAAGRARNQLIALRRSTTPQRIRLTHDFLVEHPELAGPGALGLAPELLDGKRGNGEIADSGVTLLGKNAIEISLEGREPAVREVPVGDFARFAARLEDASEASLARDEREQAVADPARDAFLSSARLGLVGDADARPSARSEAVYESTREKHGAVRQRESILPVDLVLRGDLESLGLAAFPRVRLPENPEDALLYD